ncbi:MAG TPA: hypothetical protein DDY14_17895, partial [Chromatiaceae bacterium]|nr:hypothetical protein [Chromatiaceae bacterium]
MSWNRLQTNCRRDRNVPLKMAGCQIPSQPLGNAASLDEDMVGMQLAFQGLTRSRRFPVQVLIAIAP